MNIDMLIKRLQKMRKLYGKNLPIKIWHIYPNAKTSVDGRYVTLKYVNFITDEDNDPIVEMEF